MKVLGIETSCDETGIALYDSERGLLSNALYSQAKIHAPYGGVVPELASRDHIRRVIPLTQQVLATAQVSRQDIQGVAYTAGPGLVGALFVGAAFGRSLGFARNVPTIGVHHMEAHLLAPLLETPTPTFPFVALLVSGGHTLLVTVERSGQYQLLGESLDDAAGEAFDKTAKLLGLPYPGGPSLSELAEKGNSKHFSFPRPMINRPDLNFSFSGLKTFARSTLRAVEHNDQNKADIAVAFRDAVIDTLIIKCRRALELTGFKQLVVSGGVSANRTLRERMQKTMQKIQCQVFFPRIEFSTDNGAMIAYAGCQRLLRGQQDDLTIPVYPRWPIDLLKD